ncbi:hypothetical protein C8A05DRAFT_31873 [Staphylotrichum tortipilum]|uniref:Uncharacterized protein n=1 Tax=Staphylotrichum tortipilum TaxID=2831512 RepID=A0AAN6MPW2_9PEZI|nr:hypothetical protein C8A05DRAFT_31873 [Staphylotrichum longicolle]
MEEHVAGHLRLLALKSLPTYADGGSGEPDNASPEVKSEPDIEGPNPHDLPAATGGHRPNETLWCEHIEYLSCGATFPLNDLKGWIEHNLTHLPSGGSSPTDFPPEMAGVAPPGGRQVP